MRRKRGVMGQKQFWGGFAAGAAAGLGALWAASSLGRGSKSRIIRLEKSVQIGGGVEEVFNAWADVSRLPEYCGMITSVHRYGDRSHWTVNVEGRPFEWDAEVTQIIPNEAIGWKTVGGAQHTGRINFSPIGNDTMVHVQMNYVPPMRLLRPMVSGMSGRLESYLEQALRDFKAGLEGKGQEGARRVSGSPSQATGTYGPGPEMLTRKTNEKFGEPSVPVEYTSPPDAKR
jgi:uncharacterized membrane protein